MLAELHALLRFHLRECLAGRVAVIFARELGDDFTLAAHGLFFGDIVVGRLLVVAVREIHKLFPPVGQGVSF